MQTFLPYPSFCASARCLDHQRLGKQRVEARQILFTLRVASGWSVEKLRSLKTLLFPRAIFRPNMSTGWINHPAVQMWQGFETALEVYGDICIKEWVRRRYNNAMPTLHLILPDAAMFESRIARLMPPWFGRADFHASHRSNLLRKDPEHYGQFGWDEPNDLPYVWPTNV